MLRKILSLVLNCNGRLERESTEVRKTVGAQQTNTTGGSESSIGSMVSGSDEKKIPDPWFN
jgi:hypothetical protein